MVGNYCPDAAGSIYDLPKPVTSTRELGAAARLGRAITFDMAIHKYRCNEVS